MKTFRHFTRGANYFAGDALVRTRVFQNNARFGRKTVFQNDRCALRIDAERKSVQRGRISLKRDMNPGANAQQDSLAALAILRGNDALRRQGRYSVGIVSGALGRSCIRTRFG